MGKGCGQPQLHRLVCQQPQRPALPPGWSRTTRDGDQMGLGFAVQLPGLACAGPVLQRPQVFLDKALARPLDGRDTRCHGFGNLVIGQAFISFE